LVEDFGVDHAYEQRLDRAVAEAIDDVLDGASGDELPAFGGAIVEGAILDGVRDVAFFFEAAKHGANRGVLERPVELVANLLGGEVAVLPDEANDGVFELAKLGWIVGWVAVTNHNATERNIERGDRARRFVTTCDIFQYAGRERAVLRACLFVGLMIREWQLTCDTRK
jgi:hypothetical protein